MQLTVTSPGFAPVTKIIDATHEYGVPANLDGDVWLREQLSKDMCATIFFEVSFDCRRTVHGEMHLPTWIIGLLFRHSYS